jgi:hypothetical protein
MHRAITRRDFLNGVAVTIAGALASRALAPESCLISPKILRRMLLAYESARTYRHARKSSRLV